MGAGRVLCGFMPDPHESPQEGAATDPFMGTIVLVLVALLTAVIALALGLTWKGLLHWTGEVLLIMGIALAAVGISDVRREWTRLPGTGPIPGPGWAGARCSCCCSWTWAGSGIAMAAGAGSGGCWAWPGSGAGAGACAGELPLRLISLVM